jgi:hypothetical protein
MVTGPFGRTRHLGDGQALILIATMTSVTTTSTRLSKAAVRSLDA